jgi:hypothetical protein
MLVKQRIINVVMLGYIHRLIYILISYTYMYVHTRVLSYGQIGFILVINYFKRLQRFIGKTGFYLFCLADHSGSAV